MWRGGGAQLVRGTVHESASKSLWVAGLEDEAIDSEFDPASIPSMHMSIGFLGSRCGD